MGRGKRREGDNYGRGTGWEEEERRREQREKQGMVGFGTLTLLETD